VTARTATALVLATLLVSSAHGQERPVFRADIGVVRLDATVKNARGEVVTNLDRAAFTVYEDGKAQAVTLFRRDDAPVSLGIALDNSGSMRHKRKSMEAAALALVRASNPQDEVFVLNFADKTSIDVPFTRDARALEAGVARIDSIGGTALRDAIAAGESYLTAHGVHERKALLVVTDGNDNASVSSRDEVREEAKRSRIVIHFIGLLGEEDEGKAKHARNELDDLAEETGGLAYYPQTLEEVGAIALDLARQIRCQYTIAYSPDKQALDGSYRRIRVVAKGPGRLTVRTRAGYRAVPTERQGSEHNQGE
jgi:Ca-activated chloride channel homolog